jgi:plastocyanin
MWFSSAKGAAERAIDCATLALVVTLDDGRTPTVRNDHEQRQETRMSRAGRAILVGLFVAGLVLATGCGGTSSAAHPSAATTVHMAEYSYTPGDLTVPANSKLTVINDGKLIHTYILQGIGRGTADVQPGSRATLELTGVAPGTYHVFCDQPGHTANGQSGTITITP